MLMRTTRQLARMTGTPQKRQIARKMAVRGGTAMMADFALRRVFNEDGETMGESLGKSALYGLGYAIAPYLMSAYEVGQMGVALAQLHKSGKEMLKYDKLRMGQSGVLGNGMPMDNEHAYTQRQRALQMAQQSKTRASSYGMGYEARVMSRMQRRSN
ncbi:MAG: hypothetical protein N2043_02370 [Ignavibacterium sp.]|nr:hypothetical protein [Ignavibacterium sp.]